MDIVITGTGFKTLSILKSYMRLYLAESDLENLMAQILSETKSVIESVPIRPACPELASLGVFDYLQINILSKYKVLYRLSDNGEAAFIIAFMRQKQSAQKLLVDLALLS